MKVELISPRFWMVADRGRWWTVRTTGFGGHLIMNSRGQVVLKTTRTGAHVINALNRKVG